MSGRKILIGCTAIAGVSLIILIVGGIVTYRRLTEPVPLPGPLRLVDSDSVAHGVLRLAPNDPWIAGMFAEISKYSVRDAETGEMFPVEVVWSAHRTASSAEGHILSLSFSPRGRFFGLMADLALWKAGRSGEEKLKRVEYGGEGITSFPGTPIAGYVFVRDNSIVWSSDLDTARRAVDLVVRSRDATAGSPAPPVMTLMPESGSHSLVGAIAADEGVAMRCLALLPGDGLRMPVERLAGAGMSFAFDATSADTVAGEVILHFPAQTQPAAIEAAAADLAAGIASLRWGQVVFEATPRAEPSKGIVSIKAAGLTTLYDRLLREAVKVQRTLEHSRPGHDPGWVGDPN